MMRASLNKETTMYTQSFNVPDAPNVQSEHRDIQPVLTEFEQESMAKAQLHFDQITDCP